MGATGRVRDRAARAAASAAMGETIFAGVFSGKNGGAPSSLTRPQSHHQHRTSCERSLSSSGRAALTQKHFPTQLAAAILPSR